MDLIRNTFRLASRRDWDGIKRDLKAVYTAINAAAARAAFDDLAERWGGRYPAIIGLWEFAWEELCWRDYGRRTSAAWQIDSRRRVWGYFG